MVTQKARISSSLGARIALSVTFGAILASCAEVSSLLSRDLASRDILSSNASCRAMVESAEEYLDSFAIQIIYARTEADIIGRFVSSAFGASSGAELSSRWVIAAEEVVARDSVAVMRQHASVVERFGPRAEECSSALSDSSDDGCASMAIELLAAGVLLSVSLSDDLTASFVDFPRATISRLRVSN